MTGRDKRGGACGLLHADQHDVFGVARDDERQIELELRELLGATPETKGPFPGRERSMFGTPEWYEAKCAALSKAVWHGQLTEMESSVELALWHRVALLEMESRGLWRKPRRGTGTRPPWLRRRPAPRWRGWTCSECGGQVGVYTGVCAPCHFTGWWWK